jgi:hypothetical protein
VYGLHCGEASVEPGELRVTAVLLDQVIHELDDDQLVEKGIFQHSYKT